MQSTLIRRILLQVAAWALTGTPMAALAAEVEAKKDTEVYAEATNKSEVVGQLKSGDAAKSVERKGMFWQVELQGGKTGFVSVLNVKHKPESNADLSSAIKNVVKQGREGEDGTEGRARSAVMGVRGLREDDDAANAGTVRPNLRLVFKMEDLQVQKKTIESLGEDVFGEIAQKAGAN